LRKGAQSYCACVAENDSDFWNVLEDSILKLQHLYRDVYSMPQFFTI
jgi:hypothetical protein